MAAPIISTNASGRPEIGPELPVLLKGVITRKPRVVVGWTHQTDTPNGLKSGKVWGWVSEEPEKFQVYDEDYNRSRKAGEVRFCGVANFTMVRMFHPYWAHFGRAPKDMNSTDKARCRYKYKQLMRGLRVDQRLPVPDDPENPIQPHDSDGSRRRGRPARRSRAGKAPRRRRQRRTKSPNRTNDDGPDDILAVSDDSDEEAMRARQNQNRQNFRSTSGQNGNSFATNNSLKREDREQSSRSARASVVSVVSTNPVASSESVLGLHLPNDRTTSDPASRNSTQNVSSTNDSRRSTSNAVFPTTETQMTQIASTDPDANISSLPAETAQATATPASEPIPNDDDIDYPPLPALGDTQVKDEETPLINLATNAMVGEVEIIVIDD